MHNGDKTILFGNVTPLIFNLENNFDTTIYTTIQNKKIIIIKEYIYNSFKIKLN